MDHHKIVHVIFLSFNKSMVK